MSATTKNIPVIINPSSGKPQPILHTINETFRAHNLSWRGHLTYKFGDATQFARQAVADGADMVVVYGGDGTVLEVVNGVMGSDVPEGTRLAFLGITDPFILYIKVAALAGIFASNSAWVGRSARIRSASSMRFLNGRSG